MKSIGDIRELHPKSTYFVASADIVWERRKLVDVLAESAIVKGQRKAVTRFKQDGI